MILGTVLLQMRTNMVPNVSASKNPKRTQHRSRKLYCLLNKKELYRYRILAKLSLSLILRTRQLIRKL
jgi:hypothetical protein